MDSLCKSFEFIIDIGQGPNTFELVDISYYNRVRLSLIGIFECCKCFRKFMAKLITFLERWEGTQPTITCPASYVLVVRWSRVLKKKIL